MQKTTKMTVAKTVTKKDIKPKAEVKKIFRFIRNDAMVPSGYTIADASQSKQIDQKELSRMVTGGMRLVCK